MTMRSFSVAAVAMAGLVTVAGVVPAWAAEEPVRPGTITVSGMARASVPNELAEVSVGVEAHGATVAATQGALTQSGDQLLSYLRGVAGLEQLRTEQLSVVPDTVEPKEGAARGPARIVGYDGTMRVSFRVPAAQLGTVAAGALGHGGNALDRVAFVPREQAVEATRTRLAADAVRSAMAEAGTVAAAAGRRLGAVRSIVVAPTPGVPVRMATMRAAAVPAPPPMPAEAGEAEIVATVSISVALVEP